LLANKLDLKISSKTLGRKVSYDRLIVFTFFVILVLYQQQSTMLSNIHIGSRVSGSVGPHIEVDQSAINLDQTKTIRRRRQKFIGTVVGSSANK
jgi:hypothetical protein